jgi:hypothetical protein
MSRTFSTNWGSGVSLKVSVRCGFNPKDRQIRLTADRVIPVALATDLVDQWVALVGVSSKVFAMTCSARSSVIARGTPGPGSSWRPSRRWPAKRCRHLNTVAGCTPIQAANPWLLAPVMHSSTMRHGSARDCALFGRRAGRSSVLRSSSVSASATVVLPGRAITASNRR